MPVMQKTIVGWDKTNMYTAVEERDQCKPQKKEKEKMYMKKEDNKNAKYKHKAERKHKEKENAKPAKI